VVSLDVDIVLAVEDTPGFVDAAGRQFRVRSFRHSINLAHPSSDLRIQLQIDPRYQAFIPRARSRSVLGYRMKVAIVDDVLQGKVWAFSDQSRRKSKRQKDLADIFRLVERHPRLKKKLPRTIAGLL
jgi:hypothetical protein